VVSGDASYWQSQWQRLKRMMFEAVVEEPLVILVKLADRLHNMRTVYALAPAKQQAVAEETLAVWCSMAGSLGWHGLKVR
jgi:(p)ppGpp synthase/HD superfamily hydrolase